jgi:hypothetical protein
MHPIFVYAQGIRYHVFLHKYLVSFDVNLACEFFRSLRTLILTL